MTIKDIYNSNFIWYETEPSIKNMRYELIDEFGREKLIINKEIKSILIKNNIQDFNIDNISDCLISFTCMERNSFCDYTDDNSDLLYTRKLFSFRIENNKKDSNLNFTNQMYLIIKDLIDNKEKLNGFKVQIHKEYLGSGKEYGIYIYVCNNEIILRINQFENEKINNTIDFILSNDRLQDLINFFS